MQNNSPQQVLLEVRKAYRLLYQYQRRILDLIKYIENAYQLSYEGGYTKFGSPSPRNGKGSLQHWAWDWLSMYYYEFHFRNKGINGDTIYFSVFLLNDTGFYEAKRTEPIHQLTLSKYHQVEKSDTKLIFVAGKNYWDGWGYNWDEETFVLDEKGQKKGHNPNELMIFRSYPLEDFFEESTAELSLINFQSYCVLHNIEIEFSPKKI